MRELPGTVSLSSSSRFGSKSKVMLVIPVTFAPGCARLATNPVSTASNGVNITMGMVVVAFLAAAISQLASATMRSTFSWTSSVARAGKRSRSIYHSL